MSTHKRIYLVNGSGAARLVKATNAAQALRHVTRDEYRAKVASQDDLVACLADGLEIEHATQEKGAEG